MCFDLGWSLREETFSDAKPCLGLGIYFLKVPLGKILKDFKIIIKAYLAYPFNEVISGEYLEATREFLIIRAATVASRCSTEVISMYCCRCRRRCPHHIPAPPINYILGIGRGILLQITPFEQKNEPQKQLAETHPSSEVCSLQNCSLPSSHWRQPKSIPHIQCQKGCRVFKQRGDFV